MVAPTTASTSFVLAATRYSTASEPQRVSSLSSGLSPDRPTSVWQVEEKCRKPLLASLPAKSSSVAP